MRYLHNLELLEDEEPVTQNHLLQLKIDLQKEFQHRLPGGSRPSSARTVSGFKVLDLGFALKPQTRK